MMPFKLVPECYHVWRSMKDRCYNSNYPQFKDYGGRGIKVCDQWVHNFRQFAEDMGPRPKGFTIDRIDNDGDYEPNNCRWADRKTQQRNRRYSVFVTIDGAQHRAIELADLFGLKVDTIVDRAARGLPYEKVIQREKIFCVDTSAAVKARRAKAAARTHCKDGHLYSKENTLIRRDGARQCRACHNAKMRRLTEKKRAGVQIEHLSTLF